MNLGRRYREDPWTLLTGCLFLLAVAWQLSEVIRGWDHVIIAHQGFRQSQTAISAWYFLKEGFSIHTTIPVFGAPWILPLEFPLYQWIVAAAVTVTGWPLDQTARGVSLLFQFVSLALLFRILGLLEMSLRGRLFTLTLGTLSPLALYWSQGVLIESLSVAITFGYVYFSLAFFVTGGTRLLIPAILLGALAGVVKVTTFSIGWGFLILYGLYLLWKKPENERALTRGNVLLCLSLFLLPFLAILYWISHTNSIISEIPMGPKVMSNFDWYFGSLSDRFQPDQWMQMLRNALLWSLGSPYPLIVAMIPFCFKRNDRLPILILWAAALSGPLVFWNVFYVHDYYSYETIFYLCAGLAFCFEVFREQPGRVRAGLFALQVLIMGMMVYGYYQTPYAWLVRNDYKADHAEFLAELGQTLPEDTFLVTAGYDWDPYIAYCTERKVIMARSPSVIHTEGFRESLKQTRASGMRPAGVLMNVDRLPLPAQQHLIRIVGTVEEPDRTFGNSYHFFPVKESR